MDAKAEGRSQTPANAAQTLREEMKKNMSASHGALAAAIRLAKEARVANQQAAQAAVAKAKDDLARVLAAQRSAVESAEKPTPPIAEESSMSGILSSQMKMTQESIDAAQQGIHQALEATSRLVDEAMKQAGPVVKTGGLGSKPTAQKEAPPELRKITRVRRTFRRRG